MKLGKYIPITAGAFTTTSSLFFLMHSLVNHDELLIEEAKPTRFIDYVQVIDEPEPTLIDRKLVKPEDVPERPDPVEREYINDDNVDISIDPPAPTDPGLEPEGFLLDTYIDGAQVPLVRVQANYPRRALDRNISGWTVVAFTIDATGIVQDPYIIEAEPVGYFERETLKAIKKFRYKPKVVNGQAQESHGQFRMVFSLEE